MFLEIFRLFLEYFMLVSLIGASSKERIKFIWASIKSVPFLKKQSEDCVGENSRLVSYRFVVLRRIIRTSLKTKPKTQTRLRSGRPLDFDVFRSNISVGGIDTSEESGTSENAKKKLDHLASSNSSLLYFQNTQPTWNCGIIVRISVSLRPLLISCSDMGWRPRNIGGLLLPC